MSCLPKKLSTENETKYIQQLQDDSTRENAIEKLFEHNLRLVHFVIRKYYLNCGLEKEDLFSFGSLGLLTGIRYYQEKDGLKLSTYLVKSIRSRINTQLRNAKRKSKVQVLSLNDEFFIDEDGNKKFYKEIETESLEDERCDYYEKEQQLNFVKDYFSSLSGLRKMIFQKKWGNPGDEDVSCKQIADELGVSRQDVSKILNKINVDIKKEYERQFGKNK